jgi:hypothetical protein
MGIQLTLASAHLGVTGEWKWQRFQSYAFMAVKMESEREGPIYVFCDPESLFQTLVQKIYCRPTLNMLDK